MKKRIICLFIPLLLLLTTSANAAVISPGREYQLCSRYWITPRPAQGEVIAPGCGLSLRYARYLPPSPTAGYTMSLDEVPWVIIAVTRWDTQLAEYGEYHSSFGFYTSMGCDDLCCTNPEHFHWCPTSGAARLCRLPEHEHSEAEYQEAEDDYYFYHLVPCPCHNP